jgi:hypothetical protein
MTKKHVKLEVAEKEEGVLSLALGYVWGTTQYVGDVVAQLVKATGRHQTEDAAVPSSDPAPP